MKSFTKAEFGIRMISGVASRLSLAPSKFSNESSCLCDPFGGI